MRTGKLRMTVALAASIAVCSVVLPSCSSSGATNRTASASGQSCAWPTAAGIQTSSNTGIPDSAAFYWAQPIVAAATTRIVISGTYPDARYASLSVYTPYGSPFTIDGISSSLPDYKIAPERGSNNPWRVHASSGGKFEVTVRSDVSSGQSNVLPLPSGTTAQYPGYLVYRVYLPAGGDFSRVKLPTLTMDKGSATDKLSTCTVHPKFVIAPEKAPVTTTPSSAVASAGSTPPAGEFYKPAFAGGYANADTSYVQAYFVRPAAADVMVVTGKAPTHVPGEDPSPWPAPDVDMRYWSMCIGIGVANEPTVVNHLAGGKTDYGCRADQATKVDAAGDYTYVIGTEAQRAAISRIPDVTFLPFSTSQTARLYVLLLRDSLVSSQFTNSVQNVISTLSATATSAVMGQYYPTVSTCPLVTLAAKGVQGC
jgi:hypothetical protein